MGNHKRHIEKKLGMSICAIFQKLSEEISIYL